jgi:hypothetical protein
MNTKKLIVIAAIGSALFAAVGCELVVDFDRSKIVADAGTGLDASIPPPVDATSDVAVMDGNVVDGNVVVADAAPDANDATPVLDASPNDASSDAGTDTGTDAGDDAMSDAGADADGAAN